MAEEYTVNFNLVQDAARTAALTQGNIINPGGDPNTRKANELVVSTYRPLEIYTFLILEYLVLILIVSYYVRKLENRLKYK